MMNRRELLAMMTAMGLPHIASGDPTIQPATDGGWIKYPVPVLGGQYGTCFDICVLREGALYRMWLSWRPKRSIAISESEDGIHWSAPEIVLAPDLATGWEEDISRPIVVSHDDEYHMWYTGSASERTKIGYAISPDGRSWTRQSVRPVLESTLPWEGVSVMCPHVDWDERSHAWKMWYSAGESYEPNAIGYATSRNGLQWDKYSGNPVLVPDERLPWEKDRVTAAQVFFRKGWYYAFYIGFGDIDHAQIGVARSRDGITRWIRHPANPIVRPSPGGWDADACYKPYAVFVDGRWLLWYNGRREHSEQIGLVTHTGEDLGFPR
jgi:beta-1,2-mannobiose phosphorylase / 1,2-beta-oligomannan phosphorylase